MLIHTKTTIGFNFSKAKVKVRFNFSKIIGKKVFENYVFSELIKTGFDPKYWRTKSKVEWILFWSMVLPSV